MDNKIILTIGRQFGSGGREVGQKLAKELGIGYYDKELMALAAKESGLSEEFFEKADEKASSGLAYAFMHHPPGILMHFPPRMNSMIPVLPDC